MDTLAEIYRIGPATPAAASPATAGRGQVETLTSMLASARHYLLRATREMDAATLAALPGGAPNTVGALLAHLVAAETMFQNLTREGVTFREGTDDHLRAPFRFERDPFEGAEIATYHGHLAAARRVTLELFAEVDDAWLAEPMSFAGHPSNRHYYWFHYLQDEVRHTGQIILLRKHLLPGADGSFDPYAPV